MLFRSAAAAEDAVHIAFERMFRMTGRPPLDIVAYAFAAVRNAAKDEIRRRSARNAAEVRLVSRRSIYESESPPAATEAMNAEMAAALRQAVDELPDDQREAVVMRIYGQLSFAQMADVLGEPLQTIASRYRRALDALRNQMEGLQ